MTLNPFIHEKWIVVFGMAEFCGGGMGVGLVTIRFLKVQSLTQDYESTATETLQIYLLLHFDTSYIKARVSLPGNKVGEIFRFGHSEHFRSCVSLGIDSCHWKNDRKHVLGSLTRFWKGCEANSDDQIETIYSKISSLWKIQIRIGVGYPSNFRFSQKEFIFGRTIPNRGYPENLSKKYSRRKKLGPNK